MLVYFWKGTLSLVMLKFMELDSSILQYFSYPHPYMFTSCNQGVGSTSVSSPLQSRKVLLYILKGRVYLCLFDLYGGRN